MEKVKYVFLVRHGEPDNPKGIVYNLDEDMKKEDIVHITEYGKNQLRVLGKVIKKRNFNVVKIIHSNQTRAVESALALNEVLQVKDTQSESRLRDIYAPGPYLEKVLMKEWQETGGNAYSSKWEKYNHEKPEAIFTRLNEVFQENLNNLHVGETLILLSHGDTIAWFINKLVSGKLPDPAKLREVIYPVQGKGILVTLDDKNKFIQYDIFQDPELLPGKSY